MKSLSDWKEFNAKLNGLTIYVVFIIAYFGLDYLKSIEEKIEKSNIKLSTVELQVTNIESKQDKLTVAIDHKLEIVSMKLKNNQDSLRVMFEEHGKIQRRFIGWKIDNAAEEQNVVFENIVTNALNDFNNQGVNLRQGRIINYSNPKK